MSRLSKFEQSMGVERERFGMRVLKRAALGLLMIGALSMMLPQVALADPINCDSEADYKCTFDIHSFEMQEVPSIFRFQARVSQAKFPVGDAEFSSLTVKVEKSDGEVLCQEQFRNVQVRDSVLNLEVGRMMTCKLDEEVRDNNNLKFTVCFGGNQCLKPISMGSVPYAVKATFAKQAQQAYRAQQAAQAHYAHRMTADTSIFANPQIGTGYFDFETPKVAPGQQIATSAALGTGYDTDFRPYQHDGFIQWAHCACSAQSLPRADCCRSGRRRWRDESWFGGLQRCPGIGSPRCLSKCAD